MTVLDWHDRGHFAGKPAPCRLCGRPAYCRDDDRLPCHKVCAEREATDTAASSPAPRYTHEELTVT